ncbi:MAG: efflux RND transporter permease subunit [Bacteroidales bacterium]|nr:efflux RND transporter permease subunit [Bacteroidales bacterium]
MFIFALIAIGGYGLVRMNKDEFPTFQIKQGLVAGIYPGATAEEVETQLTRPLEEYLFSFKEVNRETFRSVTKDGICYLYVDLRTDVPQAKKDEVWSKIKLGLQARKLTLPSGVLTVAVLDDFGNTSSMLVALESPDKSHYELQDYADELCGRLRQIPELAKAEITGQQQEEIAVTLDREKLSSYGIDPAQLFLDYQTASFSVPAGSFETAYTRENIHVHETVGNEREVAERIVFSTPGGDIVRPKDIARIERRYKAPDQFISYNGHPCLILNIEMRPDNDIVAFGDKVGAVLDAYARTLPDSVTLSRICDQPRVVSRSVWSFLRDLLISMLVVILVMLMLFPMRSALIASSGVPVCTAVAIAVMYAAGMPFNTVTLAALIVVLGMIVDDSIITMDGYMEHQAKGLQGVDAAASSAKELFMPTFIATLAICLMFFPIKLIITGYLGDFVSLFPWVILIALMTSLFYAVTVVPSLEVRFIGTEDPGRRKNLIARAQDAFFEKLQHIYEWCLHKCFHRPGLTLLGGLAAILLGLLMFSRLNIQMMPKAARDYFIVEMYAQAGKGVALTQARADSLQRILRKDRRVTSVTAFVGTGAPRFSATYTPILPSPQTAQLVVMTQSTRATEEILREYGDRYEHLFPDVLIRFKQMDYQAVDAPIAVQFSGEDREQLLPLAEQVSRFLHSLTGETQWVHSDGDNFAPTVDIELDSDEATRLGVSKAVLSLALSGTFGGEKIATLWDGDKQVPVNIYSEGITGEMGYRTVGDQLIPTSIPGVSVPLRQVAAIRPGWQLAQLCREKGRKTIGVYSDLKFGVSQPAVERKLKRFIRDEIEPQLPDGVSIRYGGLSSTNQAVVPEIAWSFAAACLILFLFLLLHFRKANIALLTMVLSTLCLFGASFGLWIFGLDFSITAVLGLISLVGIIVRNGILMFEYAEEARFGQGKSVRTAALLAGERRMRPIFLTSCTTALGVLPMIISGDLLWMPMGVTICFGTMLSIFLITLIMPVAYWQLFNKADKR